MARATCSLPVPLSPEISTEIDDGATRAINSAMRRIAGVCPIIGVRLTSTEKDSSRAASRTPCHDDAMPHEPHYPSKRTRLLLDRRVAKCSPDQVTVSVSISAELRSSNSIPVVCSLLFGPRSPWGTAIGNYDWRFLRRSAGRVRGIQTMPSRRNASSSSAEMPRRCRTSEVCSPRSGTCGGISSPRRPDILMAEPRTLMSL
jgi:hypothetical protein